MSHAPQGYGKVGVLTQHVTGEGDGDTLGWEFNLGNGRHVWVGELSRRSFDGLNEDQHAALRNRFGWLIALFERDGMRVLGRAADQESAKELAELIGRALVQGPEG